MLSVPWLLWLRAFCCFLLKIVSILHMNECWWMHVPLSVDVHAHMDEQDICLHRCMMFAQVCLFTCLLAHLHFLADMLRFIPRVLSQLQDANEELVRLRAQCQEYSQKMAVLSRQVTSMETDYCKLAERSKMVGISAHYNKKVDELSCKNSALLLTLLWCIKFTSSTVYFTSLYFALILYIYIFLKYFFRQWVVGLRAKWSSVNHKVGSILMSYSNLKCGKRKNVVSAFWLNAVVLPSLSMRQVYYRFPPLSPIWNVPVKSFISQNGLKQRSSS